MDKKEKKVKRIQNYFAETAMKMIKNGGIQSVSVRKVADEAGYSLGTIYNHYKNLDEMLWITRNMLIMEIAEFIERNSKDTIESVDDVVGVFKSYMDYYVLNPTVYEFLYFHKLDKGDKKSLALHEQPGFQDRFTPLVGYLMMTSGRTPEVVMNLIMSVIYIVQGLLTLYISGNDDMSKEQLYDQLELSIKLVLKTQ